MSRKSIFRAAFLLLQPQKFLFSSEFKLGNVTSNAALWTSTCVSMHNAATLKTQLYLPCWLAVRHNAGWQTASVQISALNKTAKLLCNMGVCRIYSICTHVRRIHEHLFCVCVCSVVFFPIQHYSWAPNGLIGIISTSVTLQQKTEAYWFVGEAIIWLW